jgi:hypothetical protein
MASMVKEMPVKTSFDPLDSNNDRLMREVVRLSTITTGIALGFLGGLLIFAATMWLVIKGGPNVGQHLQLLSHYFPGYRVTVLGSFIGFLYGFASGFLVGSAIGRIYNYLVGLRDR